MAKLNEMQSRPATLTATTRVDARHLATLALFWAKEGSSCRSTSELIRLSLEELANVLVTSGHAEWIDTQERALEVLSRCGLTGVRVQHSHLQKAILLERPLNLDHLVKGSLDLSAPRGTSSTPAPSHKLALAELEKRLNSPPPLIIRSEEEKSRTIEALVNLGQVPEGGSSND